MTMKIKDWLYVAAAVAAFVLGALLFRGCQKPKTSSPEIRWRVLDLDSLKAAWGYHPDTVFLPGPAKQVLRYVTVTVTNQEQADSLAARYVELANKYSQLEAELQAAWSQGQGDLIEWGVEQHTYKDSVTTPQYFHRWEIVADGPILSYSPLVIPFCPPPQPEKAPKLQRVGFFVGAQSDFSGSFRPAFGAKYGWAGLSLHGAYLPKTGTDKAAIQLLTGFEIPFR